MKKYVLITGASAGLGKAMALEMAYQGNNLILVALPNEGLAELAEHIQQTYNVAVAYYEVDLCRRANINKLVDWLCKLKLDVFYLINNAGIGGSQSFDESDVDRIERILQLNVINTALLTRQLIPFLLKFDQSYIVNVSSMAAFSPMPYKTVYPASKAFIYSFSMGLQAELASKGIQVSVLHPGPMPHSLENMARLEKHGWLARLSVVPLDLIARHTFDQVQEGRSVIIPGWPNKISYLLMQCIPWTWRKSVMTSMLRKEVSNEVPTVKYVKQTQSV